MVASPYCSSALYQTYKQNRSLCFWSDSATSPYAQGMFRRWDARTTEKRRRTERALRAVLGGAAPYARALDELHAGAGGAGAGGGGGASSRGR